MFKNIKIKLFCDIGDIKKLQKQLLKTKPDIIFHLGAQPYLNRINNLLKHSKLILWAP